MIGGIFSTDPSLEHNNHVSNKRIIVPVELLPRQSGINCPGYLNIKKCNQTPADSKISVSFKGEQRNFIGILPYER